MTDIQIIMWIVILIEWFVIGLWIGGAMAQRTPPNEPKPKNWDEKLHKEWNKGFRAGEKLTATRMSSKLKDEELVAAYNAEHRRNDE
jgi:hypothetical protein